MEGVVSQLSTLWHTTGNWPSKLCWKTKRWRWSWTPAYSAWEGISFCGRHINSLVCHRQTLHLGEQQTQIRASMFLSKHFFFLFNKQPWDLSYLNKECCDSMIQLVNMKFIHNSGWVANADSSVVISDYNLDFNFNTGNKTELNFRLLLSGVTRWITCLCLTVSIITPTICSLYYINLHKKKKNTLSLQWKVFSDVSNHVATYYEA